MDHMTAGTDVWGPALWRAIHFIALGYPAVPTEADAAAYRAFFEGLDRVIPCEVCAVNYRRHLQELPIDGYLLGSARGEGSPSLFEWTVLLHNIVDRELGKPSHDWTPQAAKAALFLPAGGGMHPSKKHPGGQPQQQQHLNYAAWLPIFFAVLAAVMAGAAVAVAVRAFR